MVDLDKTRANITVGNEVWDWFGVVMACALELIPFSLL
jgi:hypothetical protein